MQVRLRENNNEETALTNCTILIPLLRLSDLENLLQIDLLLCVIRMVFVIEPIRQCFHGHLLKLSHIQAEFMDGRTLFVCWLHYQL